MMFALMADANYKGFDLSVQFQGAALCDKMLQYSWQDLKWRNRYDPYDKTLVCKLGQRSSLSGRNSWRPDHTNAEYPRLTVSSVSSFKQCPTIGFLERNGAYLRLKKATLGYTLP